MAEDKETQKEKEALKKVLDALMGLTYSQGNFVLTQAELALRNSIFLGDK